VQAELAGALIAELQRLFNEQLLPELQQRVEAIIERELPSRVEAIIERELPSRVEAIVGPRPRPLGLSVQAGSGGSGVTADEIIACIEMVLGRTPDLSLVEYHLELGFADRFALGEYMIGTQEFRNRYFQKIPGRGTADRPVPVFLGDRVLAVTHRGNPIYLIPLDVDLTPSIVVHGQWESHVERTIFGSLQPGNTVIDLGANVGYHTLAMAGAVGPGGQVHAFEANPEVMRLLKATMFINGMGWVRLYENAALDRPGTITLASMPGHFGSGHVLIEGAPRSDYGQGYSTRVEVPAVTLDAALGNSVGPVDLIHMDIEGSEPLALRGAQALIDRSPKIKIVTEWALYMMSARADVRQYVDWLTDRHFRFWLIGAGPKLSSVDPSGVLTLPHCDLFMSRDEPPTRI